MSANSPVAGPQALAPLVAMKTRPPRPPSDGLPRERLGARLDGILADRTRLTLLSAPPGYGKTTAVAGWLAAKTVAHAWLSLDAGDNDPAGFARYLAAAVGAARPALAGDVRSLLGPGATPMPEVLGPVILEALTATDDDLVLVLDDYQAVTAQPVHALVRFLVERAPPFLHLVLLTREDPPLPLARLRAHGQLLELRAEDLRCTADEAAAYLRAGGVDMEPAPLDRVVERTEGWMAGLQLAAISLRHHPDGTAAVDAFGGSQRFVLDYLADEVLASLDAELRRFLVETSVAERFTAELCAELTGRPDADRLLRTAEQANLFLVPLDEERRWFRYHHLFAEYLRTQLDPDRRRGLHLRAAGYLERCGMTGDAIDHALAGGSGALAARLVGEGGRAAFDAGEVVTLDRWLGALPATMVEADPVLSSLRAWTLFYTGRLAEAVAVAGRRLAAGPGDTAADGQLLVLQALIATTTSPDAGALAARGLALVGDDPLFRALALEAAGLAELATGAYASALGTLREALAEAMRAGHPMAVLPALNPLGHVLMGTGRRDEAEAMCAEVLAQHTGPSGRPAAIAWSARLLLGMARYEADDVLAARRELEAGFEDARRLGVGRPVLGWAVPYLALARQATGDPEGALEVLRVSPRESRTTGMALPSLAGETEARLRLLQGDVDEAARWADRPLPEAPAGSPLFEALRLSADLTIARIRLAQDRPQDATGILGRLRAAHEATGNVADLISIGILEARAADVAGGRRVAVRALGESVRLAAPGGYRRRFLDDGRGLERLLGEVRNVAPRFVDELAVAFAGSRRTATAAGAPARAAGSAGSAGSPGRGPAILETADGLLVEALTERELDVLRRMATGESNAAIAEGLGMSVGTAKWHVGHVLAKLGATSRTQALVRAQGLALV